jgi:tRNA nucleotidyltransferase/poly(A) polymerase
MIFQIRDNERKIFEVISKAAAELGFPTYVVGGYVRDRLLARPSKDLDIVCVGSGIELAQKVGNSLHPRSRVTIYKRFGTAALKHRELEIEFVGARKESYRSDSRKPTVESGTLADDQNRRDFTINALAISLNDQDYGTIIDPFNGLEDLEAKRLVTPLEPGKTFTDDPLRMMRGIRFATQLGFMLDPATKTAIRDHSERLKIISWERIATEMHKIIGAPRPSIGFKLMADTGLLEYVLPELAAPARYRGPQRSQAQRQLPAHHPGGGPARRAQPRSLAPLGRPAPRHRQSQDQALGNRGGLDFPRPRCRRGQHGTAHLPPAALA